jgi:hypothetical protein
MASLVRLSREQDKKLEDEYAAYLRGLPGKTRQKILTMRQYYFAHRDLTPQNLRHILVDEEASYSITESSLADRTSELIRQTCGGAATITDATACVGGNTVSFAYHFRHVNSFELESQRASYLWHNCHWMCRAGTFTVFCGDFTRGSVRAGVEQDVVFFDPPWGGPDYKDRPLDSLHLFLSGLDMAEVCASLAGTTSFVCMKVPFNFAFSDFTSSIQPFAAVVRREDMRDQRHRLKFVLLILQMRPGAASTARD